MLSNSSIVYAEHFKKQLKKLSKKDRFLEKNLWKTLEFFNKEHAIAMGGDVFKIRLKGLGKGKSGGYRVYVLLVQIQGFLAPICIYAKNQQETLSFEAMKWHIKKVQEEIKPLLLS